MFAVCWLWLCDGFRIVMYGVLDLDANSCQLIWGWFRKRDLVGVRDHIGHDHDSTTESVGLFGLRSSFT